jgi:hypothetical protein
VAKQTRRAFLERIGLLGTAAAGLAALGPDLDPRRASAVEQATSIKVLVGDVVHRRGSVFAAQTAATAAGWLESPLIRTSFPFTHAGLHWRGDALQRVELRTSLDGQAWSDWQRLTVESRPLENPRGEWFAALVSAPRASFAQYRLGLDQPVPEQVTLTYLNSLDGPRQPLGSRPGAPRRLAFGSAVAHADGADFRTGIITREQWGADESLRFGPDGTEIWPRHYVAPRIVVVHHTATRNQPDDPAADVRSIYAYHAETLGWGDIGYHALLDWEGRIYEGRYGREVDPFGRFPREVLSYGVVAGHALTYNYGSAGHALLGNFQEAEPPEQMLRRLEDLLVYQHGRYQIDPRTQLDFARDTRLWRYDLPAMPGHRDCNDTECPGDNVYKRLAEIRARVAERLGGGPLPRAIVEAPAPRNLWLGSATYQWTGAAPFDCVFEGFWRDRRQDTYETLRGYDALVLPEHVVTAQTRVSFALGQPGQYTLHLRPNDSPFADRHTVLVDRHVVRDNAESEGVGREGAWTASRSVLEFNGSNYEYAAADSGARFTWRLEVPERGRYAVQACWASATDRAPDAPYTIARGATQLETVEVDQRLSGGFWVDLGSYDFAAGETCTVTLEARAGGDVVVADAIRLQLLDAG